ncbi:MAG: hypothetical protein IIA87_05330 [Nanoarchaeota archaeon]|nr:hypothetical protein [Nanoarchaeota archaeon]
MKTITIILSTILGIFLLASIWGFIITHSVSSTVNEKEIDLIIDEVIRGVIEKEIENKPGIATLFDEFYQEALSQCAGRDSISLEYEDLGKRIEVNCVKIRELEKEVFEEVVKEKIREKVKEELSLGGIYKIISFLDNALWVIGLIGAVLIIMIVFLAGMNSTFVLGVVGLVGGLPFLLVENIKEALENSINLKIAGIIGSGEILQVKLITQITDILFRDFLMVFIWGGILIVMGIALRIIKKNKSKKTTKKSKKK